MAGSSSSNLYPLVDDFYFSALFDDDELFPISDVKYAHELQLQEALISAAFSLPSSRKRVPVKEETEHLINTMATSSATDLFLKKKVKLEKEEGESSSLVVEGFCPICSEPKPAGAMFRNDKCSHSFCSDCIGRYVVLKIQDNISVVKCPHPNCGGVLEPQLCRSIVPEQVFGRWENALCESLILGAKKIYCPFKDCLAMMVDDGEESVTVSECPSCNRLFCAQCNVSWHEGSECGEFQSVAKSVGTMSSSEKEEKMVIELAKNKQWRRCPSCSFYVEKTGGCVHISCRSIFISHLFCYFFLGIILILIVDIFF
ncbi:E3 ubiquitin-protein ligase RSL1-like [Humulus lupulus]|uniref:E3 ubiquitin-protein ligase RSL1-like n=1 Tax=Humulus lupulus TaxID=3486 RepID=UPI002B40FA9D|nr:E3 ubiquitin-protein ligase RSL1-like [Humulus lupulus]